MKLLMFSFSLLCIFCVISCSQQTIKSQSNEDTIIKKDQKTIPVQLDGRIIESISISEIGKVNSDEEDPYIVYSQEEIETISTFAEMVKRGERIKGVVDVLKSDYAVTFMFQDKSTSKYYMNLGEDEGSIMNQNDSSTVYIIPEDLILSLNQLVLPNNEQVAL
ncbi:hypothetical protein [Gracilibacillus thailandensis]|uniref:YhfM-like domain-containing protein n=1 Tax=Gracilibacillus thailandensis TaxID=563735 RepID=A0A6N7R3W8_9BACI|nr:hypothetical protein [Gracilibacillus thailandensis]MRI67911.1 hypothetical protein [Gracilibacillus thailandensis]